jgi:hypothetical protein
MDSGMGNRRGRALSGLLGVCLLVAACGDGDTGSGTNDDGAQTTSAKPFDGETVAIGEAVQLSSVDGVRMQSVKDGLVRSYQTSVEVVEIGSADEAKDGDTRYRADEGGKLIAFSMTVRPDDDGTETGAEDDVVASVAVDDTPHELPSFDDVTGGDTAHYVVAVPKDRRSVDLELKYKSVTQSFDLLEGKPKGERPKALYRAADSTVVDQENLTPAAFEVSPYPPEWTTYTVQVPLVDLGYFAFNGEVPADPDKAWLSFLVDKEVEPEGICTAPLSAYALTDAAGTAYQPAEGASKVPEAGFLTDDEKAIVAFEVPVDLTSATLTVAPTQIPCETSTAEVTTVQARGQASIAVTLPKE